MDMLKITGLYKRFGNKEVLKGLDLTVPEGSIFGFIGKNGAGKTTTMKTVLGLLKADSGEIEVAGERVVYGQTATNRYIGYLPDVPEFYTFMNASEYLAFCGEITGMDKSDISARSSELLELVGLQNEKHRIRGFSRGMKQRLDPLGRKEILDIRLAVREQTTVLFSTHILSDVERICTDVALLGEGNISIEGKLSDIKTGYRRDEYTILTESRSDSEILCDTFSGITCDDQGILHFSESSHAHVEILRFICDRNISILRIERTEPTLESLFMEVIDK